MAETQLASQAMPCRGQSSPSGWGWGEEEMLKLCYCASCAVNFILLLQLAGTLRVS